MVAMVAIVEVAGSAGTFDLGALPTVWTLTGPVYILGGRCAVGRTTHADPGAGEARAPDGCVTNADRSGFRSWVGPATGSGDDDELTPSLARLESADRVGNVGEGVRAFDAGCDISVGGQLREPIEPGVVLLVQDRFQSLGDHR
jgi:hypothetical protein